MAHPVYVVDHALRQFLYYWQCGLRPSLYLDTNTDGTVFACSKVTSGQVTSELQDSRKLVRRSGHSSRRRRRRRRAGNQEETVLNEASTESYQETTFQQDGWEEGSKEFNLDNSQAFSTNDEQNFEAGSIHFTDDSDPCTEPEPNLIELDMDPSLISNLHEADHRDYHSFPSVQSSFSETACTDSCSDIPSQANTDGGGIANPIPIEVAMMELLKHINARW